MAPKAELIAKLTEEPVKPVEVTNPVKLEAKTVESPPPPVTEEGKEPIQPISELDSSRFASIAKREAKLVARDAELKAREERLKSTEEDYKKKLTPFQEFEILRSKDPVAAFRSLGFTDTDIINTLTEIGGEKKEPTVEERAAAAAQEEIKKENERRTAAERERDAAVVKKFKTETLPTFLKDNAEKYEFCTFNGPVAEEMIFKTIDQVLQDSNGEEMLTLDEAAQLVEEYYENDHKEAQKLKKLQPKAPAPETAVPEASPPPAPPAPKPKTLTNSATATVAATVNRRETREEKRTRLEELLRNGGTAKAA